MELHIESTDRIVTLDGVNCRLWNGTTSDGRKCAVFVHRIGVETDDSGEFDATLTEQHRPADPDGKLETLLEAVTQ